MVKIEELDFKGKIKKVEFLVTLKEEAGCISIMDIMEACIFLNEDAKYVQASYRKEYLKSYTDAFINRLKVLKDDKDEYTGHVDCENLQEAVELLNQQEAQISEGLGFNPKFFKIYKIMSLYTTFVLEEAVHPPKTPFPGG